MRIWLFKYDRDGYDKEGFDREGRDRWGRDRDGFNRDGFDRRGLHRNGTRHDDEGYDDEGRDRDGFGRDGLDREGFDKEHNELPTRKQGGLIVLKARVKRLERLAEISNGLLDKLGIESVQQEPSSNADVRLKLPRDDASDTAIAHFQKISEFYSTHAGLCPRCGNQLTDPPYVSNTDARILLCDVCGEQEAVCGRPGAKARENFWRWENWVANSIYESNNVIDHVQSIARFQAAKPDACPRCGCPMSPQHGHKLGIASKIEVCSHCRCAESSHRTEARSLREHVTVGSFYDWNEWFASDKEVQQLIDKLTQLEKTRKEWERQKNGRRQIRETILNGVIDSLFEKREGVDADKLCE